MRGLTPQGRVIAHRLHGLLSFCTDNLWDLGELVVPASLSSHVDPGPRGECVRTTYIYYVREDANTGFLLEVCGGNLLDYKLNM